MLRVIGAGLPRTGTSTLKTALERLLGEPCHHMEDVFGHPERNLVPFTAAGDYPDWDELFDGYGAVTDWPGSAYYDVLAEHYPDALVLLSTRDSAATWWASMSGTIVKQVSSDEGPSDPRWKAMFQKAWARSLGSADPTDPAAMEAAYDRYLDKVRSTVPAKRLLEFSADQGWEPLCTALAVPVPDEPFPHRNTRSGFKEHVKQLMDQGR